jgi:hypothetical protein
LVLTPPLRSGSSPEDLTTTTAIAIAGNRATPMQLKHHESENKPHTRRGGKDNPPTGGPRRGNAGNSAKPTAATRYAVYSGRDRLGSYGQAGDAWVAFTRLGREIGVYASEQAAVAAIDSEATPTP